MEGDGPQWLDAQPLPATARQQVTVALAVIDMLAELGDCRRFANSRDAVRYSGLEHHRLRGRHTSCVSLLS